MTKRTLDEADDLLDYIIKEYTIDEICWYVRNLFYKLNENFCELNNENEEMEENIYQNTEFQRLLSTCVDLFRQSYNKRIFDNGYLSNYFTKFKK